MRRWITDDDRFIVLLRHEVDNYRRRQACDKSHMSHTYAHGMGTQRITIVNAREKNTLACGMWRWYTYTGTVWIPDAERRVYGRLRIYGSRHEAKSQVRAFAIALAKLRFSVELVREDLREDAFRWKAREYIPLESQIDVRYLRRGSEVNDDR